MRTTTSAMHEVAESVYAFVQPDGGWCVNNAGVIAGDDATILIDTVATQARARRLRAEIDQWGIAAPEMIVTTHHHGDHTFGHAEFAPPATVIGHELTRREMAEAGLGLRGLWPDVDWGDTPLVLPRVTFTDRLVLHAGDDLAVELIHVGPAHTTNDVVAWIPRHRVLFAGDVVMCGVTPFCLMGSIRGSLTAVRRLRALRPAVVVAGHGAVGGTEVLDQTEAYLRWLTEVATDGWKAGATPLEAARQTDLGEFADLLDHERLVGNLHRAYHELDGGADGSPMDLLRPFTDMATYLGHPPVSHA